MNKGAGCGTWAYNNVFALLFLVGSVAWICLIAEDGRRETSHHGSGCLDWGQGWGFKSVEGPVTRLWEEGAEKGG